MSQVISEAIAEYEILQGGAEGSGHREGRMLTGSCLPPQPLLHPALPPSFATNTIPSFWSLLPPKLEGAAPVYVAVCPQSLAQCQAH